MKELTIQEKAKAYDKAIEIAKSEYQTHKSFNGFREMITRIFPELQESKDEKIRKELINYFIKGKEYLSLCSFSKDEILAWLEKQGERKTPQWMIDFLDSYRKKIGCSLDYDEAKDVDGKILCIKKWLEKQGEQKPTDKVEPKFKNGQWIVWQDKCYKVNYNDCGYELFDQNGLSTSWDYKTIEDNAHLWDITKDANDGDVLRIRNLTFIFHEITNNNACHKYGVVAYCSYEDNDDAFGVSGPDCITDLELITPATKEQSDALMKSMKDAEYTFDFEKKELKKIDVELTDFEKSLKHIMIETLECGDTHNLKADAEILLRLAQKPTKLDEEDIYYFTRISDLIHTAAYRNCDIDEDGKECNEYAKIIKWFKSLKQRIKE